MMINKHHKFYKQKGNATVETILIATVAVPLLTGIPLVGKISDVNNTINQSSRYLAWEQTVVGNIHKSEGQLRNEIRNRFLARPDLQIRTNRGPVTADELENPLWVGYGSNSNGEQNRLVSLDSTTNMSNANQAPSSIAGTLSTGIKQLGDTMSRVTGGEWDDIEGNGLYTGTVSVEASGNSFLAAGVDCNNQESTEVVSCISRSNTIYTDAWNAENADHAAERSRTFVPAGALEPVGNILANLVTLVPFFSDIQGLRSDANGGFGYVNPNVLPMDRYAED
jgi:hypothetical protein